MGISKITRNYQVTLPKDVRESKNFHVGDRVLFLLKDHGVDLVKLDDKAFSGASGLWSDVKETGPAFERRVRKDWNKRPKP
ncbi:MAG TPA: AbrB/MazE/SpoVT family DNA-binding domain-containing protein [Candidatus Norongarragalinales archaeon]|nr:AbrB/MazE/SpoVT family DNA-binding domain-containing protein [Candidatus Norongarragalinales archaeon]